MKTVKMNILSPDIMSQVKAFLVESKNMAKHAVNAISRREASTAGHSGTNHPIPILSALCYPDT